MRCGQCPSNTSRLVAVPGRVCRCAGGSLLKAQADEQAPAPPPGPAPPPPPRPRAACPPPRAAPPPPPPAGVVGAAGGGGGSWGWAGGAGGGGGGGGRPRGGGWRLFIGRGGEVGGRGRPRFGPRKQRHTNCGRRGSGGVDGGWAVDTHATIFQWLFSDDSWCGVPMRVAADCRAGGAGRARRGVGGSGADLRPWPGHWAARPAVRSVCSGIARRCEATCGGGAHCAGACTGGRVPCDASLVLGLAPPTPRGLGCAGAAGRGGEGYRAEKTVGGANSVGVGG